MMVLESDDFTPSFNRARVASSMPRCAQPVRNKWTTKIVL
jgi:hypothetical protein